MKSGSINWGSIGKPSYSSYEVGALSIGAPQLTNIISTGYTGTISGNQITAGRITANKVLGGTYGDLELDLQ